MLQNIDLIWWPEYDHIVQYMQDSNIYSLTFISLTHLTVKLDAVMSSKLCYE